MQQSIPGKPIAYISDNGRIHRIEEHPKGTAELAASFAAEFGCGEWGGFTEEICEQCLALTESQVNGLTLFS